MKNLSNLSILFIALFLSLTSCSTDSDNLLTGDIIGTWAGTALDYSGKTVATVQGQTINTDYVGEAYDMNYTLTFKEDPNIIISEGSYSIKLTGTVLGQTSVQNIENIEFLEAQSWSKDGNILKLTNNEKSYDCTIVELTDSALKLSLSTEEDISQQGATVTATVNATMAFVKK